ncbi:MAG: hypothetical protein H6592_05330 [Flavobacteriales bacterium]|nr:hypothetical protein [Flavobacteriales bacterium]
MYIKFLIVLLICSKATAQSPSIPPIQFSRPTSQSPSQLDSLLGMDPHTDLAVSVGVANNFAGSFRTHYAIYKPNGRVILYHSRQPSFQPIDTTIMKEVLNRRRSKKLLALLWATFDSTGFLINPDSLNLTTKTDARGRSHMMNVEDGSNYSFGIWGSKGRTFYVTYSPEPYIRGKYDGWASRERFMYLWNGYMAELDKSSTASEVAKKR